MLNGLLIAHKISISLAKHVIQLSLSFDGLGFTETHHVIHKSEVCDTNSNHQGLLINKHIQFSREMEFKNTIIATSRLENWNSSPKWRSTVICKLRVERRNNLLGQIIKERENTSKLLFLSNSYQS